MLEYEIVEIAQKAPLIVSGYAFTKREDGFISILNLMHSDCAMVVDSHGDLVETNMDPIEQRIVQNICDRNLHFMEDIMEDEGA